MAVASAACTAGLLLTGAGAGDGTPGHDTAAGAADATATPGTGLEPRSPRNTGAVPAAPGGAPAASGTTSAAPDGTSAAPGTGSPGPDDPYAGRSRVFGLVEAGSTPELVRFAPARKAQPGGPETVHPVDVGHYVTLPLAPGAVIRASAPIANDGVTDWVRGIRLTPGEFWAAMRRLEARSHPFRERSHMFELWFDRQGRITRLQHYFSP